MRITLVTASFNQAPYLEATIRSVLDQNYEDLEYIIADGGSTDGSLEIINRFRHQIAKIFTGPDGGPAAALNRAFEAASGEVFGFINSDDTLLPGALAKVAKFFSEIPNIELLSGHCHVIDGSGALLRKTYSDALNLRRQARGCSILLQPATFFRRDLYKRANGFNPTNRVCWDAELFFEFALLKARHVILDEFLACYRLHAESITGANSLHAVKQSAVDGMLKRYLHREIRWSDRLMTFVYGYWRKILNPRDTCERIRHGRIGGRMAN